MERTDKEITMACEIWGSHGGEDQDYGRMGSDAMQFF
jgi:hypothetical protein